MGGEKSGKDLKNQMVNDDFCLPGLINATVAASTHAAHCAVTTTQSFSTSVTA